MRRNIKSLLASALPYLLLCPLTLGQASGDPAPALRLEKSRRPLPWRRAGWLPASCQDLRPSFAGAVPSRGPAFPVPGTRDMAEFLKSLEAWDLSDGQREFLRNTGGLLRADNSYVHMEDSGQEDRPSLLLYAVSKADVRQMAQAYLEFSARKCRQLRRDLKVDMGRISAKIDQDQIRIRDLEANLDKDRGSLNDCAKEVSYRTEAQAQAAIQELNKALDACRIEVAGCQARIKALRDCGKDPNAADANKGQLGVLRIEAQASLKAAEARLETALHLKELGERYVDLRRKAADGPKAIEKLRGTVSDRRAAMSQIQTQLDSVVSPDAQDLTVVLYRVTGDVT